MYSTGRVEAGSQCLSSYGVSDDLHYVLVET